MIEVHPPENNDDTNSSTRRRVWSTHWRRGPLHSLSGSFALNYEGSIRRFWIEAFSPLGATHRILDVGTGNGPLPALLCELGSPDMPRVDAVDSADIDPAWLAAAPARCRDALRFHPDTPAERLPFADDTFDLVVSQYGLEYAEPERAIPEVARVLRPSGSVALIVHHAGSRLADVAREEIRLGEWLHAQGQLMATASAIFPYLAIAAQGRGEHLAADPDAGAARDALNAAMRQLDDEAARSPCPDLLFEARDVVGALMQRLLARTITLEQARAAHAAHASALDDAVFRQRELLRHALDADAVAAFSSVLQSSGLSDADVAPLFHEQYLVGWTIRATGPAHGGGAGGNG
ncbi:class I SAM-dependent methyltransferase [Luteimonas viscosa]|nr:class I SAM-dependent methyltransferase [Luteimonas viscosa]